MQRAVAELVDFGNQRMELVHLVGGSSTEGHRRDSFLKVVVKGRRSRRRIATSKAEFEKVFESSEAMTLKVVESELFDRRDSFVA